MKVIDMRCRPAYLHDFFGATPGTAAYETARWLNRRVGSRHDEHFTPSLTREGFLQEVHAAGLRHAVVVGRHTPGQHLPNDRIQQIVADDPVLLVFSAQACSVRCPSIASGVRILGTVVLQTQCQDDKARAWRAGNIEGQLVVESGLPDLQSGSHIQARTYSPAAYQLTWPVGMDASQVQRVAGSWREGVR